MLAASALLMALLFQPGHDPSRVYYGTDTRAQSLLVGAVLAMLLTRLGPVRGFLPTGDAGDRRRLPASSFSAGAWMTTSSSSVAALSRRLPVAGPVRVGGHYCRRSAGGGLVGRVLSLPPLRGLGLISYGVYLWHWPIYLELTPARTGYDGYHLFLLRVLATLAVATLSYLLVESPIRRGALNGLKAVVGVRACSGSRRRRRARHRDAGRDVFTVVIPVHCPADAHR